MDQSQKDAGTITALVIRLEKYSVPRAEHLLAKINAGKRLEDEDIDFLMGVCKDWLGMQSLIHRHPEYTSLFSKLTDLYTEICAKALMNEKQETASG